MCNQQRQNLLPRGKGGKREWKEEVTRRNECIFFCGTKLQERNGSVPSSYGDVSVNLQQALFVRSATGNLPIKRQTHSYVRDRQISWSNADIRNAAKNMSPWNTKTTAEKVKQIWLQGLSGNVKISCLLRKTLVPECYCQNSERTTIAKFTKGFPQIRNRCSSRENSKWKLSKPSFCRKKSNYEIA